MMPDPNSDARYAETYFQKIWYREAANSQRNRKRLAELMRYKPSGNLLEIGCGIGHLLALARDVFMVSGSDISAYAVSLARERLGDVIRVANIETFALPENHFDVVLAFNILEHLQEPGKTIQNIHRSLKDGGVLMGSVPNNFGLVGGLVTRITNIFDRTHVSTLSTSRWRKLFQTIGFAQTTFFGEITFGRNRCAYVKNPIWKYISFNLVFVCGKRG